MPSKAQWEKAARGTEGRIHPWGEIINIQDENYYNSETTKVSSCPEGISPYGVLDMTGNVWERVVDWYDSQLLCIYSK